MNEIGGTYNIILQRTLSYRLLVDREKLFLPSCSASPDYPDGGRRYPEQGHRQRTSYFPPDCPTLASALLVFTPARSRKGRPSPRTQTAHQATKGQRHYRSYASYDTAECNTLEHAKYGQGPGRQQGNGMPNMAAAQPKAPSGRDLQTQPRQTLYREVTRYRRLISEPAGQSACSMRRREEPDPGPRPDTTIIPATSRYSSAPNIRLHAAWNNNIVCRFEYARWQGHRRLHAQTPPSGVYPVLTAHKCQNPAGLGSASYRRQLWYPQTSEGFTMAQTPSQVSSSLHSNVQLMAQHGGALVQGDYRQTYPPRLVQERSGLDQRHYAISRESQPESPCFYLERIRRTDYDKDHQM